MDKLHVLYLYFEKHKTLPEQVQSTKDQIQQRKQKPESQRFFAQLLQHLSMQQKRQIQKRENLEEDQDEESRAASARHPTSSGRAVATKRDGRRPGRAPAPNLDPESTFGPG